MSRLPIRIRLTLPFALAMALVLAALGAYVYLRVGSTLLSSTDQSLLAQATEATLRIDRGRTPLDLDAPNGARFAQVLDARAGSSSRSRPSFLRCFHRPRRGVLPAAAHSGRAPRSSGKADAGACSPFRTRRVAPTGHSSSRARSMRAASRSSGCARSFSSPRRSRSCSQRWRATPSPVPRSVPSRRCGAKQRTSRPRRRTAGSRCPARTTRFAARRDAQRHARPPRDRLRARAAVRRRRQPRAADAARVAQDRARARAPPSEVARRAQGRAAIGGGGDRPAERARIGPPPHRPLRPERAPGPPRAAVLRGRARDRRRSVLRSRSGARSPDRGGRTATSRFDADPERIEQALGNLVENALVHGAGTVTIGRARRDEQVELRVVDEGPASPTDSPSAPSTASAEPTKHAAGAAAGSVSRSSRRSPSPTEDRRACRPAPEPRCGSRFQPGRSSGGRKAGRRLLHELEQRRLERLLERSYFGRRVRDRGSPNSGAVGRPPSTTEPAADVELTGVALWGAQTRFTRQRGVRG